MSILSDTSRLSLDKVKKTLTKCEPLTVKLPEDDSLEMLSKFTHVAKILVASTSVQSTRLSQISPDDIINIINEYETAMSVVEGKIASLLARREDMVANNGQLRKRMNTLEENQRVLEARFETVSDAIYKCVVLPNLFEQLDHSLREHNRYVANLLVTPPSTDENVSKGEPSQYKNIEGTSRKNIEGTSRDKYPGGILEPINDWGNSVYENTNEDDHFRQDLGCAGRFRIVPLIGDSSVASMLTKFEEFMNEKNIRCSVSDLLPFLENIENRKNNLWRMCNSLHQQIEQLEKEQNDPGKDIKIGAELLQFF